MAKYPTSYDEEEEDDMSNELHYLRSAYNDNDKKDWISGKELSADDLLMLGIIED